MHGKPAAEPDGLISQQSVPLHRSPNPMTATLSRSDGGQEEVAIPQNMALPTNLIVTGTVNVDETTYGFSPKVLDRAMVIEFDEVDLAALRSGSSQEADVGDGYRLPEFLPDYQIATLTDYAALPIETHQHIIDMNGSWKRPVFTSDTALQTKWRSSYLFTTQCSRRYLMMWGCSSSSRCRCSPKGSAKATRQPCEA